MTRGKRRGISKKGTSRGQSGGHSENIAKADAPPPEAMCRVLLKKARVVSVQVAPRWRQLHDDAVFLWPVDVEVDGKLFFPPSAPGKPFTSETARKGRTQKVEEVEISVRAVVDKIEDRLVIKCEDMKVEPNKKGNDDAASHSWLHRDNILEEIQKLMSDRLSASVSEPASPTSSADLSTMSWRTADVRI